MILRGFLMGTGIIVCGLNGAGKSTLGKALAKRLDFHFIDIEDLYFPKDDPAYLYASPRTREEVSERLLREVKTHEHFVFASVKGDYGESIYPFYRVAIWIEVPKSIRMQRVKDRSYQKFGERMFPGGDLYEQEEQFFDFVNSREDAEVEKWVKSLGCPLIKIDGTRPAQDNIRLITEQMNLDSGGRYYGNSI